MNRFLYSPGRIVSLGRYGWVCLVLATLLLFNPFYAAPRFGNSLEVCHPVSHRATVGACELQHFSPTDGWDYHPAVNLADEATALPLPDLTAPFFIVLPFTPLLARQFYGPGLWFRPPPAR